jgi:hypothetical protein
MRSLNLDYYYGNESEQFSFFRIPKVLFTDDQFADLSAESKVLYGMLLDRMGLSRVNGWLDNENRVYIIFTIEEIQSNLNCSRQKAVNLMAELDDKKGIGLIEKKRQGLGKPNLIYVKNFILVKAVSVENTEDFKKSKNHTSESMINGTQEVQKIDFKKYDNQTSRSTKTELQEVSKLDGNNTNLIHTDFSDIELNHIQSNHIFETDGRDRIQNRQHYEKIIKDNLEYELIYQESQMSKEDVGNIIDIMVDVCIMPDDSTIKVNGVSLPIGVVRERFMEITSMHIDYIIDSLKENPSDIRNIRSYLITTIFNAPATMSQYYRAKINRDYSSGVFYKGGDTCKSR